MTASGRILRLIGERTVPLEAGGGLTLRTKSGETVHIASAAVTALASEGLVARTDGLLQRTAEGRAFLKRALSQIPEDGFAAQHRHVVARTIEPGAAPLPTNAAESPLAWLATRRDKAGRPMLTREQLEAGRRLAAEHERANRRDSVTQHWDASGVRGGSGSRDRLTVSESANDARRRVERAMADVGTGLAGVLFAVCCEEQGLEAVEKRYGWPARCGKVVLRLALDRLAEHYGIAASAEGPTLSRLLKWGARDYRPAA